MQTAFFAGSKPRLFAHRGASLKAPENTLPAFCLAEGWGVPYLELDVRSSRDGQIVVIHDDTLERTTNGRGKVGAHTLDELKKLDAGYHFSSSGGSSFPFRGKGVCVPTLEEVLQACPRAKVVIEIKQAEPPIEERVLDIVGRCGRQADVLLASAHDRVLKRVRGLAPQIATSFAAGEVGEFIERVYAAGIDGYTPPAPALQIPPEHQGLPLVTPETIRAAHALGVEVHVWTINDPQEMWRLLELGVDGMMSDDPEKLQETVEAWQRSRYNLG